MTRPKVFTGLLCLVVAAGATAGIVAKSRSHAAAVARQREVYRIDKAGTMETANPEITQLDAGPGVLALKASCPVDEFPFHDRPIWWRMEVRAWNPEAGGHTPIWWREYRDQAVIVAAGRKGQVKFAEQLELAPGQYQVFVGTVEGVNFSDGAGNIIADHGGMNGKAVMMTVR